MLDSNLLQSKPLNCSRHRKEKATQLCIDPKCISNPLLCPQCISEGLNRSYHYDHEKSIIILPEAIESLCNTIKTQSVSMQRIYKSTLGRGEFATIAAQLDKGEFLIEEMEDRVATIKKQADLELDLLVNEFQKLLLIEKQEYFKILENYQKAFLKNVEHLKNQAQPLLTFQNSIKYYTNINNFYLKMESEMNRKSDWIIKTKKSIQSATKIIESPTFSSDFNNTLALSNKIKLDVLPAWKGEESIEQSNEMRFVIKRALNQWIYTPELKLLEDEMDSSPKTPQGSGTSSILKNYYMSSNSK